MSVMGTCGWANPGHLLSAPVMDSAECLRPTVETVGAGNPAGPVSMAGTDQGGLFPPKQ